MSVNDHLHIGPGGLALIKEKEGWYPKAYLDPVGVWTIGWGTTGADAVPGRVITKEQGEAFLRRDMREAENDIKKLVTVPLNQNQFDALVSFVYNLGAGNLGKSTLLKLLNRGNYEGAAGQFQYFNNARDRCTGRFGPLPGLTIRRRQERDLFLSEDMGDTSVDFVDSGQYDVQDPSCNDGTCRAERVPGRPGAMREVMRNSDTFKSLMGIFTGFMAMMASMFQQIASNPVAMILAVVVIIGICVAVYIKYRDTKEGR